MCGVLILILYRPAWPASYLCLVLLQFHFPLVYLLFHRRGNWITLKLKKLIKSSSREHGPDRPPTPTHSGVTEPQLSCQDNSSFISSDGSGSSATSAGDAISPQRNSEYDHLPLTWRNRCHQSTEVPPFSASVIDQEVRSSSEAGHKDHSGVCSCKAQPTARGQRDMGESKATVVSSTHEATFAGQTSSKNLTKLPPPPQHFSRRCKNLNKTFFK